MTVKQQIAITGLLVLVAGLLLGLIPGSVTDTFSCGSPWVRDTAMAGAADRGAELGSALLGRESTTSYAALCDDKLDARGVWGGVLAGLGVLTLLGVALVNAQQSTKSAGA